MKIELSETEIVHIMDALRERINDLRETNAIHLDVETADLAHELEELEHDLFEASARPGDWTEDLEPTEIAEGSTFTVAEDDFIDAGIQAREQAKESSRASIRRAKRFGEFDVSRPDRKLSETQRFDLWDDSDPKNW
jgi:hypothetical protein